MSLRIQISDLLSRPGQTRSETASVPLRFEVGDAAIDDEAAVVAVLRSLTDGIIATGTIDTTADLSCTRCLATFGELVDIEFEAIFRTHPDDADEEYPIESGGWIDLEPVVHDEVSLSVPVRPLCKPDCLGLCQSCGTDLNTAPCGGHGDEPDSPFAALKHLFDS